MRTQTVATLFSSLTLGLFACGGDDAPIADDHGAQTQEVSWRHCGIAAERDVECAEVSVPLDHDHPDAGDIQIAINRVKADPTVPYHGVLFVNPGGPGGSGKGFAVDYANMGLADLYSPGYDIVGFDPRGVVESGERGCGPEPEAPMDATEMAPMEFGLDDYVDSIRAIGERCASAWGPLFDKLGSNQVVRDMDRLRQALGQATFNYVGISYGTRLGALYAHEFPESAGLMILDASMPPQTDLVAMTRDGFAASISLQEVFFQDCDSAELVCPPDARGLFDEMVAAAEDLGIGIEVVDRWVSALAYPESRAELPLLLEQQASEPDSQWLLSLIEQPSLFAGIGLVPNRSVSCIDANTAPPTLEEVEALYVEFAAQNELFAYQAVGAMMCAGWPVTRDPVPMPTAPDAPPLLLIGGTQDLLTPLPEAQQMAAALGNATLLVSNHYGHSAMHYPSECVFNAVHDFLDHGALPANGTTCE
jgi:pimeloyl-ACP methyl ester carboxylesterase